MDAPVTRRRALRHLAVAGTTFAAFAAHADVLGATGKARQRPKVIAFDVIETLFDPSPVDAALAGIGLPAGSLKVWFPRFLRDAFALELAQVFKPFGEVATASLQALCRENEVKAGAADFDSVLQTFAGLSAHPEVKAAFEAVQAGGVRMITLTNGSAGATRRMLKGAGLESLVERIISIDEVQHWKPASEVYHHAAKAMGVEPAEMALIAAHDWDTAGAARAGLTSVGVDRRGSFSAALPPPHFTCRSVLEAVQALLDLA